ncbi:polysaccharide deacetylase family sporulation protein PdaB [Desulfohalotomaculum tongense]|uniref:polysaccharide deacetylase family protein n=1 Tax=Desulforadius tongensis TaxID=1216062 RepID=UPI001EE53C4B|nr:polysaccharide deacetylase family protein [Desulforadius tongensis]MBM7855045.1 polysaccharide deacetylase family sporulation protein PdaB [Desulforadius tongensis]
MPIIAAFLAVAVVLTTAVIRTNNVTTTSGENIVKPQQAAYYRVKTDQKVVALTFDWSYGTKVAQPVLDILKERNIRCTFFISGPAALKYPEISKRIAAEGHEVASHGHEHVDLDKLPKEKIKENILNAHKNIKEATGKEAKLLRCPNGAWRGAVLEAANEVGYTVIQWDTDSLDWFKDRSSAQIAEKVLKEVHPGDIILMHASDVTDRTPEALPIILDGLEKEGYKIVTVSELLKYGPGTTD